jgi:hypothetical protein
MVADPYESVLAGTFIYSLGVLAGRAGASLDNRSATLLAQNPGDQNIGDVVASWGGRSIIVEFKRSRDTIGTERRKAHKSRFQVDLLSDGALRALSEKGHLLAYGETPPGSRSERARQVGFCFFPYWWALAGTTYSSTRWPLSLEDLFGRLTREEAGFSPGDFTEYLAKLFPRAGTRGGSGISSIIVNVDERSGRMTFVAVDLARVHDLTLNGVTRDRGWSRDLGESGDRGL